MEPLFLSFASQVRVNVSSRPSSRLATAETLMPCRGPHVPRDSLVRRDTLYVSFNPHGLLVPLMFYVFREDAHTASMEFVARDA